MARINPAPHAPARSTLATALTATALALTGVAAAAAQPQPNARVIDEPTQERIDELFDQFGELHEVLITIDFPGGSVTEYADTLERAMQLNMIVADPELADIPMGPVSLTAVPFGQAVRLIAGARGADIVEVDVFDSVYRVRLLSSVFAAPGAGEVRRTEIFGLEAMLGPGFDVEAVSEAIELTLTTAGAEDTDIRLHEPTSLLIVHGREAAREAVEGVLEALEDRYRAERRRLADEARQAQIEAQQDHTNLQNELREATQKTNEAIAEARRLEGRLRVERARNAQLEEQLEAIRQQLSESQNRDDRSDGEDRDGSS
jgi:hypothetical protein